MKYIIGTVYRSCTLKIDIVAKKQCQVNLDVRDVKQPDTIFTHRFRLFAPDERQSLYVQMPITGKQAFITIFEEGMSEDSMPVSFTVEKMRLLPLAKQLDAMPDAKFLNEFIPFAERFSFNAGVLPTYNGRIYISKKGNIKIKYLDKITEDDGEQLTPARIGIYDKIIEISKSKFKPMTVPSRMAILCHEYCHLFCNKDMYDEVEADLNGIQIYIMLGFPIIELDETYLSTFYQSQTEVNYERYERITSFIEKMKQLTLLNA